MPEFSSVEFLNENESRSYPLKEGSDLPDSLILDLRVFSRGQRSFDCRISRVVGADVSISGSLEITVDTGCLDPEGESTDLVKLLIPSPAPNQSSVQAFGWNPSPFGENRPEVPMGEIGDSPVGLWSSVVVTVGAVGHGLVDGDDIIPTTSFVEPSLVYLGGSTSIHRLSIGEDEDVTGKIAFVSSRNLVPEATGGSMLIRAGKGLGEGQLSVSQFSSLYGIDLSDLEITQPCDGVIQKVNGIGPNSRGQFSILDGRGLSVMSFPESNLIVITTAFAMQSKVCPELPELGDIYLWILDGDGNLVPTDALPDVLVPGQAWVLDQFGRLTPAETFDFDPYWGEGGGGISP